jgi:uncharacterized protein
MPLSPTVRLAWPWLLACASAAQETPLTPKQEPSPPVAITGAARLSKAASPYLRQHQTNPVDWYPWGAEALARAKELDRPIFLSIGYSACHWCHVMAAESFADPAIAAAMNRDFVCIKVDREERPDVDEIYMAAVQAMGHQGGWPLSVWLTPDGKPFYGGTYFPPNDAANRPGFRRVCEHLAAAWRERREEVLAGATELTAHLQQVLAPSLPAGEPDAALLPKLRTQAEERFDRVHPGLAPAPHHAPKFPQALELAALLGLDDDSTGQLVVPMLRAMQNGGIHDHLGGGFHRYSTDRAWRVPHFEKMLYDQALLVPCYVRAFQRTGDATFAATARSTIGYLLRELRDPAGGFWSSQDAQSEGVEGKFFVWSDSEITALLGDDAALLRAHFGITKDGNWEHTNVLAVQREPAVLANELGVPVTAVEARLRTARERLFQARGQRREPATDDKVLAAWNGMTLHALALAHQVLGDADCKAAAQDAANFLLRELLVDGRLGRSWHQGSRHHQGTLEDYGAVADGLLSLFAIDSDPRWLAAAKTLLTTAVARFGSDDGGFFFTADDHEALLARTKTAVDGATASGTALLTMALLRGGLLLGDQALYERGVNALRANHAMLSESPAAVPALVLALQFHVGGPREIVIAGEPEDPRTRTLLGVAWTAPHAVVASVNRGNAIALAKLSPILGDKEPIDGAPAAYVCERGACLAPITDPAALAAALTKR